MTAIVWMRGFLQDEYGVDFSTIHYRTGSVNATGLKERLPLDLPATLDVQPAPVDRSLNDLLLAGELDAIYTPATPKAFDDGDPRIKTLFADPVAEEKAYFRKTGFFPIMHIVAIRKSLVEEHPWLPANVFKAFVEAKKIALAYMDDIALGTGNRSSLPWFRPQWEETKCLMGEDIWSYGLRENRAEVEAICRYSHEQHLSANRLTLEEMFEPSTHELPGR
jgi:4,5-dihydroxyphthalate decarboxylase